MVSLNINLNEIAIFFSILLRVGVILFMLPIFSASGLPNNIKVLTVVSISLMLVPLVRQSVQPLPFDPCSMLVIIAGEVIFGIIFSLSMLIVVAAFQFAGELVSFQMGFGFSQVADPQTGVEDTVLSVWAQLFALMIFFSLNGHHIVLRLIVESFRTVPIGGFTLNPALFGKIATLSGMLFVLAVKLAAPLIAVLILTQLGLGLIAKFAPQINILATSFPLTIALGVLFLSITVITWGDMATRNFADLFHFLGKLIR